MIFFVANDGTVMESVPSPVYQGSANANDIYLVAPFASNLQATVAFKLPNGVLTEQYAMTLFGELEGVINKQTGKPYLGWQFSMPNEITRYHGVVTAQFFFYAADSTVVISTSSVTFTVGRGVPELLPNAPSADIYETILSNLSSIQQQLDNGTFTAKSIYAWNSAYTYGAGELVFYPQKGEYGVFLKSLTDNNKAEPYVNGVLDTANWLLVSDFNILTELYSLKGDILDAVQETRDNVAATAQSANEAESSSQQAAQSATAAENAAQRIESQAQYLEGVKDGTIAVPKATSDGNGENIAEHFETIESYIPSSTSAENQLADKAFVNSSINNMAAFYITSNAGGDAFATRASLLNAAVYYYGGEPRTPTQNDYAIVLADESQPKGVDSNYPTTRYTYQGGEWAFQYVVNNTSLTQAQVNAINSGITKEIVDQISKGNVLSVNGETGAVTITPANIGAVNKSGDSMTGKLIVPQVDVSNQSAIEIAAEAVTPHIDFHYNNDTGDFTSRIIEEQKGVVNILPILHENGQRVYSPNNPQRLYSHFIRVNGSGDSAMFSFISSYSEPFTATDDLYEYLVVKLGEGGYYAVAGQWKVYPISNLSRNYDSGGNISKLGIMCRVDGTITRVSLSVNCTDKVAEI